MTISILQTEIPRRCNSCQNCSAVFAGGDQYCSVLENIGRQDYCIPCWTQIHSPSSSSRCFWKAAIPQKKENISISQNKIASTINLLKANIEKNPPEALLLALYLVRKRILILRKDFAEGDQIFGLFEVQATEEMIAVKRVSFSKIDIHATKASIASQLNRISG